MPRGRKYVKRGKKTRKSRRRRSPNKRLRSFPGRVGYRL